MEAPPEIAVPEQYVCPISMCIMLMPVYGPDGVRYDRLHILRWLKTNATSPCTNTPLRADELVADADLAKRIRGFILRDAKTTLALLKSLHAPQPTAPQDMAESLLLSTIAFYEQECAQEASAAAAKESPASRLLEEGHLKLGRDGSLFSLEVEDDGPRAVALWDMHIDVASFRTMADADSSDDDGVKEEFEQIYASRTRVERRTYEGEGELVEILDRLALDGYCIIDRLRQSL